jgi:hypothetical protein
LGYALRADPTYDSVVQAPETKALNRSRNGRKA